MRVSDCDMLEVAPESGAVNYRVRHKRTGELVGIHILLGRGPAAHEVLSLLGRLGPAERSQVLDHGQDGSLTYFVTQGLPAGDGFLGWLNRYSNSGSNTTAGVAPDDAPAGDMTPARMLALREIFDRASDLPAGERAAFVSRRCAGDRALEVRALRMLGIGDTGERFLEVPAAERMVAAERVMKVFGDSTSHATETIQPDALEKEFAPGALIGERYLVEREVGRGGFGIIYLASDQQVNKRHVVLKVRKGGADPMNPETIKRFQREVASLALIAHPSVVGVLDVGRTEWGTPYFVMQYVPGLTLRQKLKADGPLPLARVAVIVRQISHALSVAHEKGICHRDLKPENVMLHDLGDGEELPIIIDFGIATMKESNSSKTVLTRAIGTIAYMPPEQREGRPTPASDTYALGVMTYEMLTGRRPDRSVELRRQKLAVNRRGVPRSVDAAIAKAISELPADRQERTRDFGDEIWAALQPSRTPSRDRFLYWALVVLIGICAGLGILLAISSRAHPPRAISYSVNAGGQGHRIRLTVPRKGYLYLVEEKLPGRFEILSTNLSYFSLPLRYLSERSVEFTLPPVRRGATRVLWAIWSEARVDAAEKLARRQRDNPAVAASGVESPEIASWAKEIETSEGEQTTAGPVMKKIQLSGE